MATANKVVEKEALGNAPSSPAVKTGRGIVKAVRSADSLVLQEDKPSTQGPPAERMISLSSLSTPRFASKPGEEDEVWVILFLLLLLL